MADERFNRDTERCRAHGDFHCGKCLRDWCDASDRRDLARQIEVTGAQRGPRGGECRSIDYLATVRRAWREYETSA